MAYKKPQIVAKSAAKQTYVAGCPTNRPTTNVMNCTHNLSCECGSGR